MPPAAQAAAGCSGDSLGVGNSAHMAAISCPGSSAMLGAGDSVVVSPGQGVEASPTTAGHSGGEGCFESAETWA